MRQQLQFMHIGLSRSRLYACPQWLLLCAPFISFDKSKPDQELVGCGHSIYFDHVDQKQELPNGLQLTYIGIWTAYTCRS